MAFRQAKIVLLSSLLNKLIERIKNVYLLYFLISYSK